MNECVCWVCCCSVSSPHVHSKLPAGSVGLGGEPPVVMCSCHTGALLCRRVDFGAWEGAVPACGRQQSGHCWPGHGKGSHVRGYRTLSAWCLHSQTQAVLHCTPGALTVHMGFQALRLLSLFKTACGKPRAGSPRSCRAALRRGTVPHLPFAHRGLSMTIVSTWNQRQFLLK